MVRQSKVIVDQLIGVNPNVKSKGFAAAVSALSESKFLREAASAIVPDAYLIDGDVLTIFEVVDTHPIRAAKGDRIAALDDEMDEVHMSLRVVVLDYTGHVVSETPGWAYGHNHAGRFANKACMDMTPAARAAYRVARAST